MKIIHQEPAARGMVRVWVEDDALDPGEAVMFKLPDASPHTITAALVRVVASRQEAARAARRESLRTLEPDAIVAVDERATEVQRIDEEIAALIRRREALTQRVR